MQACGNHKIEKALEHAINVDLEVIIFQKRPLEHWYIMLFLSIPTTGQVPEERLMHTAAHTLSDDYLLRRTHWTFDSFVSLQKFSWGKKERMDLVKLGATILLAKRTRSAEIEGFFSLYSGKNKARKVSKHCFSVIARSNAMHDYVVMLSKVAKVEMTKLNRVFVY